MPTPPDNELTRSRAKRNEVAAKLEVEQDEEMVKYFHLVIVQWDKYIQRLEAKLQVKVEG